MGFSFTTFSDGATLSAADLNAELAKIESKFGNIKNSDISDDAAITSQKLADRFAVAYQTVCFVNSSLENGGKWETESEDTFASMPSVRLYPEFPGKRAYLVAASVSVVGYVDGVSAASDLVVHLSHNGTSIDSVTFDSDDTEQVLYFRAGAGATAFATPFVALQTSDYIGLHFGSTSDTDNASNATCTSLSVTLTYKIELTA